MARIIATSGKGGVGKSTVSHAIAVEFAGRGEKTLIIDCDKNGRATERVLSPNGNIKVVPNEVSYTGIENLYAGAVAPLEFVDLPRMDEIGDMTSKERNVQFGEFMGQFPGGYGLVAYNVLFNQFFGVASSPEQVADFISLTNILRESEKMEVEKIVLDLEPTSGTKRMLGNMTQTAKTLKDMGEYSMAKLMMIGAQFPDIKRFLKSDYMKSAEGHGDSLMKYADMIVGADYTLVCGPESSMVDEMIYDTEPMIRSYGGKISRYVVNNIRSNLQEIETLAQKEQLVRVKREGKSKGIKVASVYHNVHLNSKVDDGVRISYLMKVGKGVLR